MRISGSTVMLTGASGGLGGALADEFAARGARLILTGRDRTRLEALAHRTGGEVVVADLTDVDQLEHLTRRVQESDILVANAGIGGDVPIERVTTDDIERVISTNLHGPIILSTYFVQAHLEQGTPAHVALIGSLAGLMVTPNSRLYNATKFGLRGFGLGLREDLFDTPVGVSLVEPGFIRGAGMFVDSGVGLPKGVRTQSPEQVAQTVIKAIESDAGEVFAAPIELAALAKFATVAPSVSAWLQRRLGVAQRTAARRANAQ